MTIRLPYGNRELQADVDWGRCLGVLDINDVPQVADPDAVIRHAIEDPIGMPQSIYQIVRPGETVAILVSDAFRKTCVDQVLPILLEGLRRAGIREEAVRIVFATGSHRPPTYEEQATIVGLEVFRRFQGRLLVHDPADEDNLVYVGTTSRGTPVRVNRRVYDCDRLIVTGAVVLHYFAGYGGGCKSLVPGICGLDTIAHNHALNLDPHCDRIDPAVRIGVLDGNPVAEDMLEGSRFLKVDYLINTVLNRESRIAGVFAGDLAAAHRAAAAFAHRLYTSPITEQADLVIASAGDTRNFVQSHKALYNASQAMKPDGRIVFLAQCPEGLGGEQFAQWLRLGSRQAIFAALRQHSEINGQTALSTIQRGPDTLMVTDLAPADVALLRARKAIGLANALSDARRYLMASGEHRPTYYVMPSAAYTVPVLQT